ncbi:MAG: hypothetical protein A3G34_16825 [Candidatus Lindowbacteria bacterium RIFCSPLOWO2_12_FULL_62_27]|nr:MAG: hypothetical protein A3G34_16825 [Candidatus Lindowbacteria bacterium RIFCSPLOWO2_12_FULL_62_27]
MRGIAREVKSEPDRLGFPRHKPDLFLSHEPVLRTAVNRLAIRPVDVQKRDKYYFLAPSLTTLIETSTASPGL